MRKFQRFALIVMLLLLTAAPALAGRLTVYTSMRESLIGALKEAFLKSHPDIEFDCYVAGAGKLMSKIASERASGGVLADVLWHSEVPDFFLLKREGLLEPYLSPEARHVESLVQDPEGYFTPVRNGTLAIAYNTDLVKEAPTTWQDLTDPKFKDSVGIADPRLSGTAFGSIAALARALGWEYFEACRANGLRLEQGSSQIVSDTADGNLLACIAVDYMAVDKIRNGDALGFVYPQEIIMLPSPVAVMKGSPNAADARKFVDFLLSREGQTIIAASGTIPVRPDIPLPADTPLPDPREAVRRAIRLDFEELLETREDIIGKCDELLHPSR